MSPDVTPAIPEDDPVIEVRTGQLGVVTEPSEPAMIQGIGRPGRRGVRRQ